MERVPPETAEMADCIKQVDCIVRNIPSNITSNPVMVQMFSSVAIRLWNIAVTKCSSKGMDSLTNANGANTILWLFILHSKLKADEYVLSYGCSAATGAQSLPAVQQDARVASGSGKDDHNGVQNGQSVLGYAQYIPSVSFVKG